MRQQEKHFNRRGHGKRPWCHLISLVLVFKRSTVNEQKKTTALSSHNPMKTRDNDCYRKLQIYLCPRFRLTFDYVSRTIMVSFIQPSLFPFLTGPCVFPLFCLRHYRRLACVKRQKYSSFIAEGSQNCVKVIKGMVTPSDKPIQPLRCPLRIKILPRAIVSWFNRFCWKDIEEFQEESKTSGKWSTEN